MRILNFSGFLLLCSTAVFAQSLDETVAWALENNNQIKASIKETEASESEWQSLEKGQLPSFSLDASYRHITDVASISFPASPLASARNISLGVKDSYEGGLNVKYVLFSGFAETEAAKVKELEYKIKQSGQHQTEKDIAYSTIEAYRNAQFFKLHIKTLNDALKRNDVQFNKVKALLKNGMALKLDTLSLSLARMGIKQQIIRTNSIYENWLQILQMLTAKDIDPLRFEEKTAPEYANFILEDQNLFRSVQLRRQMLGSIVKVEESAYYPKVFLGASIKYGKPGVDFINNEWMSYGVWNVGLTWDVWNWQADKKRVIAARLKQSSLHFQEEALKDQLNLKYKNAERDYKSLQEQYYVAQKSVKVAREKMKIIQINTEKGQLSTSDFNEANLELSQAELTEQQNLIMLHLKACEIDYLSGQPISKWRLNK